MAKINPLVATGGAVIGALAGAAAVYALSDTKTRNKLQRGVNHVMKKGGRAASMLEEKAQGLKRKKRASITASKKG